MLEPRTQYIQWLVKNVQELMQDAMDSCTAMGTVFPITPSIADSEPWEIREVRGGCDVRRSVASFISVSEPGCTSSSGGC